MQNSPFTGGGGAGSKMKNTHWQQRGSKWVRTDGKISMGMTFSWENELFSK
jgi:hypothetical protein